MHLTGVMRGNNAKNRAMICDTVGAKTTHHGPKHTSDCALEGGRPFHYHACGIVLASVWKVLVVCVVIIARGQVMTWAWRRDQKGGVMRAPCEKMVLVALI